jgi:hypothetical protein
MVKFFGAKVGRLVGWVMTTGGSAIALTIFLSTVAFATIVGAVFTLKVGVITGLVLLLITSPVWVGYGLLPLVLGGVMLKGSHKLKREAIRDRFLQLVRAKRGRFTAVEFARAAQLDLSLAQTYLDRWARECHADFDVTESGEIQYLFLEPNLLTGGDAPFEIFERMKEKVSLP